MGLHARGFLAAVGLNAVLALLAFCFWAEWGPYAWVAAGQLAVMDSYSTKLTLFLVLLAFAVPIVLLLMPIFKAGRAVLAVAFGVPALAVALHLATTAYFLVTGGPAAESASFPAAVGSASLLPRPFSLKAAQLAPLDVDRTAGIRRSSSGYDDEEFIPFARVSWPADDTPVVLEARRIDFDEINRSGEIQGNVRRAPLPYLVRRAWGPDAPTVAIIVTNRESVREYWMLPAIFYILLFLFGAWRLWKTRRAGSG